MHKTYDFLPRGFVNQVYTLDDEKITVESRAGRKEYLWKNFAGAFLQESGGDGGAAEVVKQIAPLGLRSVIKAGSSLVGSCDQIPFVYLHNGRKKISRHLWVPKNGPSREAFLNDLKKCLDKKWYGENIGYLAFRRKMNMGNLGVVAGSCLFATAIAALFFGLIALWTSLSEQALQKLGLPAEWLTFITEVLSFFNLG